MPIYMSCLIVFLVTLFVIYLSIPVAHRIDLVDKPTKRKQHTGHAALIGGISILFGMVIGVLTINTSLVCYRPLFASAAILVFIGVLDDFKELSARARLLGQVCVALLVTVWGGVVVHSLGDLWFLGNVYLGVFAIPFTVIAIVGVINAMNMSDGVDGLAVSTGMIMVCYLLMLSFLIHSWKDTMILSLFFSALLGFACFNFPVRSRFSAKVFMGDAGSMLLGLILAWYLVRFSQKPDAAAPPVVFLWIIALPLFDMGGVMCRRMLKKQSPFQADREHIHHLLLALGCSKRGTLFFLMMLNLIFGGAGLGMFFLGVPQSIMFMLFMMVFCVFLLGINIFWYRLRRVKV